MESAGRGSGGDLTEKEVMKQGRDFLREGQNILSAWSEFNKATMDFYLNRGGIGYPEGGSHKV